MRCDTTLYSSRELGRRTEAQSEYRDQLLTKSLDRAMRVRALPIENSHFGGTTNLTIKCVKGYLRKTPSPPGVDTFDDGC